MKNLIGLSVLVLLLACVSAGYQENEATKREAVESNDLDLNAENQKRDSEIQKRGLLKWAKWGLAAYGLKKLLGKREDLNSGNQKRDLGIQDFLGWVNDNSNWLLPLAYKVFGGSKREDLTAEELETQRRALFELYENNSW